MNKRVFILIFCLSLIGAAANPQKEPEVAPVNIKSLDPTFQDFLKLVTYIITPKEKEVFLQLANDRDRNIFLTSFWKLRDPTPGTPENEYRDEINRRFAYVNKRLASTQPGWKTDRGKYYMILGEPRSYDRYPGTNGLVPCEVWYYYTDGSKGLPSHFGLVFFQKSGFGDYRLYDPFVDGPKSLMQNSTSTLTLDPEDYENLHAEIAKMAPALADMSISLIPGEFGYGFVPTSQNTMLLAKIIDSPKANINPVYATHFFDYKGMVSTEYLTNYIESQGLTAIIQDPILHLPFVHFSLTPQTLTLDFFDEKNQYFCDVKLDVGLRWQDKVVYQYTRDFPLYFSEDDVERFRRSGISFEDSFPAAEGDFTLTVLLQNTTGKEFTVFERAISIPETSSRSALNGPVLGYKVETLDGNTHIPFKAVNQKLDIDPKMIFGISDQIAIMFNVVNMTQDLWQNGEVNLSLQGLGNAPTVKNYSIRLNTSPFSGILNLVRVLPATDLPPDYYKVKLSLIGPDKRVWDEKDGEFMISTEKAVAHPIAKSKGFPLANQYYYDYQLGSEYDKLDRNDQAESHFAEGYSRNPGYNEGVVEYAHFLLKVQKFDTALEVIENLKGSDKNRFDYFFIKGQAVMGKGDFSKAVDPLQEANKIYNSDTRLLNALGFCFYKTGMKAEALGALNASLRLNPDQNKIKDLLDRVEKELK